MLIRPPRTKFELFAISDVPASPEPFRLLNRIPIHECGEPLVDLRETNPELSFGVYCLPYVRRSVAEALKCATAHVPPHLDLWIFTALRTLEQQAEMYWGNYRRAKEQHPNWPESVLRKMTNRFFAPPDAKAPPGHCTGAAVDVGLLDAQTGESIDVRSPHNGWDGAPTAVKGLSDVASENRRLLCFIMYSTGLSNCRDEFWHWSFGDSAWAVRTGAADACYGSIEPPPGFTRVTGPKIIQGDGSISALGDLDALRERLSTYMGESILGIEHVGSSGIPGMSCDPILDIAMKLRPGGVQRLIELGYEVPNHAEDLKLGLFRPPNDQTPKGGEERKWPAHQIFALEDGAEYDRFVRFRQILVNDPAARAKYSSMKNALALRHPWDRIRYRREKTPIICDLLERSVR
ncbi:MAG: GrpB family protein [Fimbriimonas sp.]|nr:GrpB family protein [Fimbriimonas sp.]